MKAAFFFDTFLIKNNNDYYGMTLTYDFFKTRYLKYYDEIIVSTRYKRLQDENGNIDGYNKTNGKNVIVRPIKNYKKISDGIIKKKKIEEEIYNIISECDVVIIRLPSMIGSIACKVCKENNKDYLVEVVACAWDGYMYHNNKMGKIVAPYMFLKTRRCVRNAPKVLYVTEKFLQKRYPTNGKAIYCSDVIIKEINQDEINKRIKKIENLGGDIKIGTVANVNLKYKGQQYVIMALSRLPRSFKYYLVGNGNNRRLINIAKKYKVEDRVFFLGSLEHDKVFNFLDNIDLYIQPSFLEGLPRSLIEAMSKGLPCIGSSVGGIPELLPKKYLFKAGRYKQIEKLLRNLDKAEMSKMCLENYKKSINFRKKNLEEKRKEFYM